MAWLEWLINYEKRLSDWRIRLEDVYLDRVNEINDWIAVSEKEIKSGNSILPKSWIEDEIKAEREYLKKTKEVRDKFIRLAERYKHKSIDERAEIYQDWADWLTAPFDVTILATIFGTKTYPSISKEPDKFVEESKKDDEVLEASKQEAKVKMEEIEKRFDKKLSTPFS